MQNLVYLDNSATSFPKMDKIGGTVQISFGPFNTLEPVSRIVDAIREIARAMAAQRHDLIGCNHPAVALEKWNTRKSTRN